MSLPIVLQKDATIPNDCTPILLQLVTPNDDSVCRCDAHVNRGIIVLWRLSCLFWGG